MAQNILKFFGRQPRPASQPARLNVASVQPPVTPIPTIASLDPEVFYGPDERSALKACVNQEIAADPTDIRKSLNVIANHVSDMWGAYYTKAVGILDSGATQFDRLLAQSQATPSQDVTQPDDSFRKTIIEGLEVRAKNVITLEAEIKRLESDVITHATGILGDPARAALAKALSTLMILVAFGFVAATSVVEFTMNVGLARSSTDQMTSIMVSIGLIITVGIGTWFGAESVRQLNTYHDAKRAFVSFQRKDPKIAAGLEVYAVEGPLFWFKMVFFNFAWVGALAYAFYMRSEFVAAEKTPNPGDLIGSGILCFRGLVVFMLEAFAFGKLDHPRMAELMNAKDNLAKAKAARESALKGADMVGKRIKALEVEDRQNYVGGGAQNARAPEQDLRALQDVFRLRLSQLRDSAKWFKQKATESGAKYLELVVLGDGDGFKPEAIAAEPSLPLLLEGNLKQTPPDMTRYETIVSTSIPVSTPQQRPGRLTADQIIEQEWKPALARVAKAIRDEKTREEDERRKFVTDDI